MGDVSINVRITNMPQIRKAFGQAPDLMSKNLQTAIKKSILIIKGRAVQKSPVRSGYLRSSAYISYGILKGEVGFNARYAGYVHEGTSPHIIRPRFKKALYWKGASHPVMSVNHPGTRANPFLRRAVEENEDKIQKFFTEALDRTLEKIAKDTK